MPEFTLFVIVGFLAVLASAMMVLSDNAVYSALFLIVTMICIAFFFILLDAPFLAMVQITVYAGAIMVLFIFVIMLLGADRTTEGRPVFRWQAPAAFSLIMALLFAGGITIANSRIDAQEPAPADPLVRVLHSASDVGPVAVAVGAVAVADELDFRDASAFVQVTPGPSEITLTTAAGSSVNVPIELEPDTTQTLIIYGEDGEITFASVPALEVEPASGTTALSIFNAYTADEYISVYDMGLNARLDREGDTILDEPVVERLELGAATEALVLREGSVDWAFVRPNGETLLALQNHDVIGETNELMVVSAERTFEGGVRLVAEPVYIEAETPGFGSPQMIGRELFTRYMLVFQMVALLLLAAMVGAIMLTHPEGVPVRERPQGRRKVNRPLTSVIASQIEDDRNAPQLPREGQPGAD